ncbi:WPP domain-associated protein-like [Phalaenopsis equestris]|uniref:WPP domain-associated protein-like n=1 Tax=Phalaenopsis equestris TaxID=78828 RepID=UPI0009E32EBE|nr:WPP domain-associated protein-like [Phalaenopsis equestris]
MERMEADLLWNKNSLSDEEVGSAAEENMIFGINFNETDTVGNESAHYEKFLLDDFDNYVDEINDRLTVSRLVTDSVIKGIVNAVIEESTEKIALKEAEIACLKAKLHASNYVNSLAPSVAASVNLNLSFDSITTNHLSRIKMSVENQFQRLKEEFDYVRNSKFSCSTNVCSTNKVVFKVPTQGRTDEKLHVLSKKIEFFRVMLFGYFDEINNLFSSMKLSAMEQQWENELHEEINAILVQNYVRDIQEKCETKILEQRKQMNALSTKVGELSLVREDLNAISKSLLNSDQSLLLSHSSSESLEELNNTRWKDQFHVKALGNNHSSSASHKGENGANMMQEAQHFGKPMLESMDFHLKHLSKEDLADYYKIEMTKMRRQHDKAMEEKTDELFRLKREFLKEKGSLFSKKDKEIENLKKHIRRIIVNLDDILAEELDFVVCDDSNEVCTLKNKISSMFIENQRLRGLLIGKRKEAEYLSSQVTDFGFQILQNASVNQNLLEQIANLKGKLEDLNTEVAVKEEIDAIVLNEVISKLNLQMEDAVMENSFIHDFYSVFIKESVRNEMFMINDITLKRQAEKASLDSVISQKETALHSELEENDKLKQEIISLSALISENEKVVLEGETSITQRREEFDTVYRELDELRDRISMQMLIISENKIHSDFMRSQFDDALQQLTVYEMEVDNLNQKLAIASSSLEESERQKIVLNGIIEERENKSQYSILDGTKEEVEQVEVMLSLWKKLSEDSLDFESKLAETIKINESRFAYYILRALIYHSSFMHYFTLRTIFCYWDRFLYPFAIY